MCYNLFNLGYTGLTIKVNPAGLPGELFSFVAAVVVFAYPTVASIEIITNTSTMIKLTFLVLLLNCFPYLYPFLILFNIYYRIFNYAKITLVVAVS